MSDPSLTSMFMSANCTDLSVPLQYKPNYHMLTLKSMHYMRYTKTANILLYRSVLTFVFGAQKKSLIEMVGSFEYPQHNMF